MGVPLKASAEASEEAVGGLVGEQDAAVAVGADDGDGAGLDEVLELLLEAAADGHLGLDLAEVRWRRAGG